MVTLFFLLFLGLELKHYIADYFLQPAWILNGKGNLRQWGGYAHAALHALLTALVLLLATTPLPWLAALALAEAGAHVIALARTQGALESLDDEIRARAEPRSIGRGVEASGRRRPASRRRSTSPSSASPGASATRSWWCSARAS